MVLWVKKDTCPNTPSGEGSTVLTHQSLMHHIHLLHASLVSSRDRTPARSAVYIEAGRRWGRASPGIDFEHCELRAYMGPGALVKLYKNRSWLACALESRGIDPLTCRMLSDRSTI